MARLSLPRARRPPRSHARSRTNYYGVLKLKLAHDEQAIMEVARRPEVIRVSDFADMMEVTETWKSTKEAKAEYYLTTEDLQSLDVASVGGGVGCGRPSYYYNPKDLRALAIKKYGEEEFTRKQQARGKRGQAKQKREDAAQQAAQQAKENLPPAGETNQSLPGDVADPKALSLLIKSLLKMSKKNLGFVKWGNTPKSWRVELPMVQPPTFAALLGCPTDTKLASFVKAGAYYSEKLSATELFKCKDADLVRQFKREGVGIKICEHVTLRYKPSTQTLSLSGDGEIHW